MVVFRNDKLIKSIPWLHINTVIIFGIHNITTPALRKAMQYEVVIHFANGVGKYQGCTTGRQDPPNGVNFWLQQQSHFVQEEHCLTAAKVIVAAKITHNAELLRRRGIDFLPLHESLNQLKQAETLSTLNGVEGYAAKYYFEQISTVLPTWCRFNHRNRQPPKDPFNVLLSMGYTMLYSYCDSIARADGLLPWIGFYHSERPSHAALASDLMEPFRYLVDRVALKMILNQQLVETDFSYPEAGHCLLTHKAKRLFINNFIGQLQQPIKALNGDQAYTIYQHLHRQNLSLIQWIRGEKPFEAWRTR